MPNSIITIIDRVGSQRILVVLLGIGAAGVIWGFSQWGMAPSFVPVASGLPLEQVGQATQLLDDADIKYELERGGSLVMVADRDAAAARVALAAQGLSGTSDGSGYELFDQQSWGMTDFTQRVNYRRALEGEIKRTIERMRDVETARVHLALPESSFLRAAQEAGEASIVLKLRSGTTPNASVVEGIQALVAGSVQGLPVESVTVLDDRGQLLSSPSTEEGAGMTNAQLKVRSQVEEYLQGRAEGLVSRIVGPGNASIRVAADLTFEQFARTTQALDPDQQMLMSEDRSEITPGDPEQGAASSTVNTTFEATRSVETMTRGGARLERLTVAVLLSDRRTVNADGTITFAARTAAELRQVEGLVANAVGISEDRGDEISVVSLPFEIPPALPELDEAFDFTGLAMAAQRPVIALAGLGVAVFLTLQILGTLKTLAPASSPSRFEQQASQPALPLPQSGTESVQAPVAAQPAVQVTDPEMAARVLRSWMQEA